MSLGWAIFSTVPTSRQLGPRFGRRLTTVSRGRATMMQSLEVPAQDVDRGEPHPSTTVAEGDRPIRVLCRQRMIQPASNVEPLSTGFDFGNREAARFNHDLLTKCRRSRPTNDQSSRGQKRSELSMKRDQTPARRARQAIIFPADVAVAQAAWRCWRRCAGPRHG